MIAKRYRKKPVIIEALQFDGSEESAQAIVSWAAAHGTAIGIERGMAYGGGPLVSLAIPTKEGEMVGQATDFIIRGIANEFYPCKEPIFDGSYDSVAEEESAQ